MTTLPDPNALAVSYRLVTQLVPYARNARTNSDRQIAEIAASIREFGWTNPVLVDGENGIIAATGGSWQQGSSVLVRFPSLSYAVSARHRSGPMCLPTTSWR